MDLLAPEMPKQHRRLRPAAKQVKTLPVVHNLVYSGLMHIEDGFGRVIAPLQESLTRLTTITARVPDTTARCFSTYFRPSNGTMIPVKSQGISKWTIDGYARQTSMHLQTVPSRSPRDAER